MSFISYLKDGISLGSIYAIIALGYTMVYGIAKMLNFAHGDVIMVGAYIILTCITRGGMSPILFSGSPPYNIPDVLFPCTSVHRKTMLHGY